MKRLFSTLIVCLLLTSVMSAGTQTAEQEIAGFETALGNAMIHKDTATLTKLIADDWTIQSESGTTGTKIEFIDDVRSGALVVKSFRIHDVHIRVVGDMAFIQAFDDEISSYKGKDNSGTYNWLDAWEKRNGQWVSVATQLTKVQVAK